MTGEKNGIWKYCYWMNQTAFNQLKKEMAEHKTTMTQAQMNPCEALRGDVGYAEPAVWDVICKHDAAPWYRASKHAGESLVVASYPLGTQYTPFLETTIEESDFEPIDFPPEGELFELAHDTDYRSRVPEGWGELPQDMGDAIVRGLNSLSAKKLGSFKDLLAHWDAVHANFAHPRHRANRLFMHAPYSIDDSTHIGTCCVELFNLLDAEEDVLLVRPCIGSVIVRVLEKNRYYLVRLVKRTAENNSGM